jgi:hypothetical protein
VVCHKLRLGMDGRIKSGNDARRKQTHAGSGAGQKRVFPNRRFVATGLDPVVSAFFAKVDVTDIRRRGRDNPGSGTASLAAGREGKAGIGRLGAGTAAGQAGRGPGREQQHGGG